MDPVVLLTILKDLRDNWSNEVPATLVLQGNFKVRRNWFQAILYALHLVPFCGFGVCHRLREFDLLCKGLNKDRGRRTTHAEIMAGDALISEVIAALEHPKLHVVVIRFAIMT